MKSRTYRCIYFWPGHLGHSDSITSIDCHTDNALVLTGSTDLTAKLVNSNTGKVSIGIITDFTMNCA